jgi:PKD repeat protein
MRKLGVFLVITLPIVLSGCALNNAITNIMNDVPEAVIDASPKEGYAPLQVIFSAGNSQDDGDIASYYWDFGDTYDPNPTTGITANHYYEYPGTYLVKLTVTDNKGKLSYKKELITVTNPAPVASFYMSNDAPKEGDEVSFNATGSYDANGTIVSYDWDFGDGDTGSGVEVTHSYSDVGYHRVALTATDNYGATTVVRHGLNVQPFRVDCGVDAPLAVITGLPSCKGWEAGVPIELDGSSSRAADGVIVHYKWDFGDGEFAAGACVSHTYEKSGSYIVSLTVIDDAGTRATAFGTIDINDSGCGVPGL